MEILQNLRYAARGLARQPGFTAMAVFTLAVGIGANTAIYSVVDATLLRPLPFREPARLMAVSLTTPSLWGRPGQDDMIWSYPKYETFSRMQQVFGSLALYRGATFNLTGAGDPERLRGELVSAAYFPLLGVRTHVGRTFLPEEDLTPQKDFVAVISYDLWSRRFGADPAITGKTVSLDQRSYSVAGVAPAGFQGLNGPSDVWVPAHTRAAIDLSRPQSHSWSMVARLKPGVTVEQAKTGVKVLGPRIDEAYPMRNAPGWGAKARTLDEARMDPALRKSVLVLFGAVGFVLLIACVNVANLLLARGAARGREIAIRLAIGAGRGRLVRQLLAESLLLAVLGGVASLTVAYVAVQALTAINPGADQTFTFGHRLSGLTLLGLGSIRLDWRAFLFAFGCALACGVFFGLAPALHSARANVTDALKSGGKSSSSGGIRILAGKSVLVAAEVALAVVLFTGAGLMIKSFGRLTTTRSGVDPDHVLTVRLTVPGPARNSENFFTEVEARLAALPGALSAGRADCHAFAGGCSSTLIWFRDRPPVPEGSEPLVNIVWASADYFKTMRIPLLRGRMFASGDRMGAPKVVLVNETAARRFWPGEDPVGKPIGVAEAGFEDRAEVIGVAADVRYGRMDEAPQPGVYVPYAQSPVGNCMLFVRSAGNPASLIPAVRRAVMAVNHTVPTYDIKTMNERIRAASSRARFSTVLLGVFAAIALVLAVVGVYGVMSYLVTQRTREMGIRMALGARRGDVVSLVLRRGAALALAGLAAGVPAALAATRVLATLLYDVKPSDPQTYILTAVAIAAAALFASYLPALRASSVDPSSALRSE